MWIIIVKIYSKMRKSSFIEENTNWHYMIYEVWRAYIFRFIAIYYSSFHISFTLFFFHLFSCYVSLFILKVSMPSEKKKNFFCDIYLCRWWNSHVSYFEFGLSQRLIAHTEKNICVLLNEWEIDNISFHILTIRCCME